MLILIILITIILIIIIIIINLSRKNLKFMHSFFYVHQNEQNGLTRFAVTLLVV